MPPTAPPFSSPSPQSQAQPIPYPALYLYPLNDSFVPKHIALNHGQHVKIGRQTNAKTAPGERNGYFDSKVLSRQHAEVWEEGGKIYIKDVKSSNGTFINGERLSSEAVESEPYELKSDDIVEFGIDIVGDDNKTIIHHKVAARVNCIFSDQDAQVAARAEAHQQAQAQQAAQQQQHQQQQQNGAYGQQGLANGAGTLSGAPNGFNFSGSQPSPSGSSLGPNGVMGVGPRRAPMAQSTLAGMGGMGGSMRPPGKSGLTFDVILSRLQGELQKSRETGAELSTLTGVLGDVGDVLAGGLPPNLPSYSSILPPIRPRSQEPPAPPPADPVPPPPSDQEPSPSIAELQAQLKDTQASLADQLDKIRALEGVLGEQQQRGVEGKEEVVQRVLGEQEEMKREVERLRSLVEEQRIRVEHEHEQQQALQHRQLTPVEEEEEGEEEDDDDDNRSVVTVTPGMEEEDEKERKERGEEVEKDRPRTPEPSAVLNDAGTIRVKPRAGTITGKDHVQAQLVALSSKVDGFSSLSQRREAWPDALKKLDTVEAKVATLDSKLEGLDSMARRLDELVGLADRLESVVRITSTLEAQHAEAQSTIKGLEGKVQALEGLLKERERRDVEKAQAAKPQEKEGLTERIGEWMKNVDGKWASVQSEWKEERERLKGAREEWESKVKQVDSGLQSIASLQAEARRMSASFAGHSLGNGGIYVNGDVVKHNGLVTPPSPRSQSSDSGSGRYRRRRRRGRSRSEEESASASASSESEGEAKSSKKGGKPRVAGKGRAGQFIDRDDSPTRGRVEEEGEDDLHSEASASMGGSMIRSKGSAIITSVSNANASMPTPAASVADVDSNPPETRRSSFGTTDTQASPVKDDSATTPKGDPEAKVLTRPNNVHVQTAVGVLLLSVAAAAVIWKVRPDSR